jgi:retinoid hydroxylase
MMVVSGHLGKKVLLSEFAPVGGVKTGTGLESSSVITGKHSILYAQQEKEHQSLRRLIGQAMTPEAITRAIPTLESVISKSLDAMVAAASAAPVTPETKKKQSFIMENVCTDFTLDVAHSQILGLDLKDEEIPEFRRRVNEWIFGAFSPRIMFLPFPKRSKAYKARMYLVERITRKIEKLRASGKDDGSTLSAMVFAKDEESQQRLTDIEIIDNALILILAGSETAASTLTNAILFLGLHPEMYRKIQEEQQAVIAKNNGSTELTRTILDKELPYLEAFIKETMRIRPIDSGALRFAKETIVLDGKQIPKGEVIIVNIQLTHEFDPLVSEPNRQHMDVFKGFKPERWLDPETRPSADYMPFGAGPRYCLG